MGKIENEVQANLGGSCVDGAARAAFKTVAAAVDKLDATKQDRPAHATKPKQPIVDGLRFVIPSEKYDPVEYAITTKAGGQIEVLWTAPKGGSTDYTARTVEGHFHSGFWKVTALPPPEKCGRVAVIDADGRWQTGKVGSVSSGVVRVLNDDGTKRVIGVSYWTPENVVVLSTKTGLQTYSQVVVFANGKRLTEADPITIEQPKCGTCNFGYVDPPLPTCPFDSPPKNDTIVRLEQMLAEIREAVGCRNKESAVEGVKRFVSDVRNGLIGDVPVSSFERMRKERDKSEHDAQTWHDKFDAVCRVRDEYKAQAEVAKKDADVWKRMWEACKEDDERLSEKLQRIKKAVGAKYEETAEQACSRVVKERDDSLAYERKRDETFDEVREFLGAHYGETLQAAAMRVANIAKAFVPGAIELKGAVLSTFQAGGTRNLDAIYRAGFVFENNGATISPTDYERFKKAKRFTLRLLPES